MKSLWMAVAAAGLVAGTSPAFANECANGVCAVPTAARTVETVLAAQAAPSARELQSNVDAYLASSKSDASLVGGCGSAGYDGGFWIRGGTFLMKINLTLQTRFEYFDWDQKQSEANEGGDLSGFSLPRVTLKFSGDATCDVHYYAELEFGHSGSFFDNSTGRQTLNAQVFFLEHGSVERLGTSADYGIAREAWIEYEAAPQLAFRMGLVKTATTRQLMTPPELQQFVDVSLASVFVGALMPGYSDRNRDYGFMVHGALGCDGEWQYMLTVTNGDGPVHRNVLDGTTDDPLAYSARVNWDIKGHMGYEEGALRQHSCEWSAAVGAWAHYYADHLTENVLVKKMDRLTWGVDAAAGWGGLSLTAAYSGINWDGSDLLGTEFDGFAWFAQAGYLFPDTAWEIAARYGVQSREYDVTDPYKTFGATEYAFAVNYYIDGHADKVTLDASFIQADDDGNYLADAYAGYSATDTSDAMLLRLQWQLAL